MARRNRNVTLEELRAALTRFGGDRMKATSWLGVSYQWTMELIRKHEAAGAELPRTPHRRLHRLEVEDEHEPTPEEIETAKAELHRRRMEAKCPTP